MVICMLFFKYGIKLGRSCLPCLGTTPHYSTFPEDTLVLKRSYRCGFTNNIFEVQQLLDSAMHDLFTKMQSPDHCLYPLLPSHKDCYIRLHLDLEVMIMSYQTVLIICISSRIF